MTTYLFFILILVALGIQLSPSNLVNAYDLRFILQRFINADSQRHNLAKKKGHLPTPGIHPIPCNSVNAYDLRSIIQRFTNADRSDGCKDKLDRSVEVISWVPRVVIYHNFLSKEECEHLIYIAQPHMKKSTQYSDVGEIIDTGVHPCTLTYLARGLDETVRAIEKKIADFTYLPAENGEGLRVQHYEVGQHYLMHNDFFTSEYYLKNIGGQTIATVEMRLSDVEEGGETMFPCATPNITTLECWNDKIGKKVYVKPKMGDAVLIWNMKPDATLDISAVHAECPVIKGSKWSATAWIRVKP